MEWQNVGWKAFWDSNPDWPRLSLRLEAKFKHSGGARPVWEEYGPCPVFACYVMAILLKLRGEKSTEKTSVRVVGKCQLGTIQCIDMAMTEQQVYAFYIHTAIQSLTKTSQEQSNGHRRHGITVWRQAECTDTQRETL